MAAPSLLCGNLCHVLLTGWRSLQLTKRSSGLVFLFPSPLLLLVLFRLGHHRAGCARAGVLGGRGFSVKNAVVGVCHEAAPASPRTSSSVIWTSQRSGCTGAASRFLLMVCLFRWRHWRWTLRLCRPSLPRRQCADMDGAAPRRCKQRTHPELDGHGRARLVVLAEVGGPWSEEAVRS